MDITLEKKTSTEGSIKITLKEDDYQPKVEEKIKEYSKKANVKGFRPGKVPTSYIKKLYGKSILVEEINQILSHSLTNYIRENKINILGEPLPNTDEQSSIDWDHQKEFDFEYSVGMVDDFKYDLSKKVKITAYDIELDDKTLNKTLEDLKVQYGEMTNPESSEEGDSLYGTLQQPESEFSNDTLLNIDDIEKKERKKFIGAKKDDSIKFDLGKTIKDELVLQQITGKSKEEAADLKGDFEFIVKNVNRKVPAELNQEFFDKIFGKDIVKSEEEFIEKVKSTIGENYQRESNMFLDTSIQKELIKATKMEIPDEFLKRWLLTSNQGKVTEEDIEREYDIYVEDLKWNLIKNKIGEDNEIKVEHEDVNEKAKNLIREQLGQSGLSEQLEANIDSFADNYLKGENGNNYMKVYNQVQAEKIMDTIKGSITITRKKVDVEKFKKIVQN
ncbi:trigger factor [Fulvivirgaceae bacterium BMA10]|uniref:Trigger factor n=1 Tax=Splendidivirga corallicola TaxID=3051826 RepID=A0ABT8KR88_9BACT|nr:trigger factor [Fulvivirgaceae bacterium BMA10]